VLRIGQNVAHSPKHQLLRGELKSRGGRSAKAGNQLVAGAATVSLSDRGECREGGGGEGGVTTVAADGTTSSTAIRLVHSLTTAAASAAGGATVAETTGGRDYCLNGQADELSGFARRAKNPTAPV
jgi:hypothetical protein